MLIDSPVSVAGMAVGVAHAAKLDVDGDIVGAGVGSSEFVGFESGAVVEGRECESTFSVLDGGHDYVV